MKKRIIICATFIILSGTLLGQTNIPDLMKLENDISYISGSAKTMWSLGVRFKKSENLPISSTEASRRISESINDQLSSERYYGAKYQKELEKYFSDQILIGMERCQYAVRESEVPFKVYKILEDSKLLLVTPLVVDVVYNTLRLTSRQRAARTITRFITPSLKNFRSLIDETNFDYFGLGIVYGSEDPSKDYSSVEGEYIAFIVPGNSIMAFINGDITEDELVEEAIIYVSDRDMMYSARKIKVTIE